MIQKALGLKVLILPVSLAAVAMIFIVYIQPEYSEMRKIKTSILDKETQLAGLEAQNVRLAELKKILESMDEVKIVNSALPDNEAAENYLAELYQRAVRSGVAMSALAISESAAGSVAGICQGEAQSSADLSQAPDAPVGGPVYAAGNSSTPGDTDASASAANAAVSSSCARGLSFQISVKGSWDQLLAFFGYLADSNRIANVSKVNLATASASGQGEQQATDIISATISMEAYVKPKSSASDAGALRTLASGAGFSKDIIRKVNEIIYSPYEPPLVSETGERNFFK
ncbi:MAG: hypothetical protein FJ045_05875 [Crenarchaeota archaeon]|nr:hypothetical protein [Thermoproteota archaeon]